MSKIKEYLKSLRKVFVFIICIVVGIVVSLFMPIEYYDKFLMFLGAVAIGFFTGNAAEHISNRITGRGEQP